jgi:hypothetical protein
MWLGCTRETLETREFKETELGPEWWYYKFDGNIMIPYLNNGYENGNEPLEYLIKLTPRKLLQILGTEAGRNIIHPDIWCTLLFVDYDSEVWRDIEGQEGKYQISSYGNVRSLNRITVYGDNKGEYHTIQGKDLNPTKSGSYLTIGIGGKTISVHTLVAKTFCKGYKDGLVCNHKDGNKFNNYYKNLEWVTQTQNIKHAKKLGLNCKGEEIGASKLKEHEVITIKKLLQENISASKIARVYNVSKGSIHNIKKGKSWSYLDEIIKPIKPITPPNWVITDNRFPNEIARVKREGGITIKIIRPTFLRFPEEWKNFDISADKDHPRTDKNFLEFLKVSNWEPYRKLYTSLTHYSETALDNYEDFDYIVFNDGTIGELIEKLKQILIKEKII